MLQKLKVFAMTPKYVTTKSETFLLRYREVYDLDSILNVVAVPVTATNVPTAPLNVFSLVAFFTKWIGLADLKQEA